MWNRYARQQRIGGLLGIRFLLFYGWDCHVYAIETVFKKDGFARRSAPKKPKLTQKHADARLAWALEHISWTEEQWAWILWTNKSWIQPEKHKKMKVRRCPGDELYRDFVEDKVRRRIGWMFWGDIQDIWERISTFLGE